ncbi:MAG: zinc ribbon domain-containing protein, partial [Nitrososphaerales archaeon]
MTATGKICPRCGTNNVEEADFCIKCGLKIRSSGESPNHESLVYLHILGSSYLLFTALLNRLVLPLFLAGGASLLIYILLYVIPIISGFYVAYEVRRKRISRAI